MEYTWTIAQLERNTAEDFVVTVHYRISAVDGEYTASTYGTVGSITALGIHTLTTGSAANVNVNASGVLARSTSSLKYKTDVQDAVHGLAEVMRLRPVTYKGKNDGELIFGGLIAEEVHEANLSEFVQYAEDGSPDSLAYPNMVSLAFKAIQELKAINDAQAIIDSLKARLDAANL